MPSKKSSLGAYDDFEDAAGTAVIGKALDYGGVWSQFHNNGNVASFNVKTGGYCEPIKTSGGSYGAVYAITDDTGLSDVLIELDVTTHNTASSGFLEIIARSNGGVYGTVGTDVVIAILITNNNLQYIYEVVNGAGAVIGGGSTINIPLNTRMTISFTLKGNQATITTPYGSMTRTLPNPKTHKRHGIGPYSITASLGTKIHSFKVSPAP